jgi:hypothetical protein
MFCVFVIEYINCCIDTKQKSDFQNISYSESLHWIIVIFSKLYSLLMIFIAANCQQTTRLSHGINCFNFLCSGLWNTVFLHVLVPLVVILSVIYGFVLHVGISKLFVSYTHFNWSIVERGVKHHKPNYDNESNTPCSLKHKTSYHIAILKFNLLSSMSSYCGTLFFFMSWYLW